MSDADHYADLISERECDFAETLAALHELLGSTVTMWVLGARPRSRDAAVIVCAPVLGGLEFSEDCADPVGIQIGDALLVIAPDRLGGASRQEYERRSDCARWTVVSLVFRGGVTVEIEGRPDP